MSAPRIPREAIAPLPPAQLDRTRVAGIMAKVRELELRTKRLVDSSLAGGYRSAFRGRGIDFDRVREYVAGDEVRTIDWNVTARAGRLFVKQFREERELTLMLAVDVSASGDFGSDAPRKRDLAGELACVLAMSAVTNNDLVGLVLFSDRIERFVPPAKGRAHALRIIREILGMRPRGTGTNIALPLELLQQILRRRSVVALISDLAASDFERSARTLAAHHDVVALQICDPRERALPNVGLVALEDAETGEVVQIDTARRKVRDRFAQLSRERGAQRRRTLRASGIDTVELDTARPYVAPLHAFFANRARRKS
jgi:uncharacterized protein (DUF58 family)